MGDKIKVTSLEIIVTGTKEKPYFEIKYKEVGKDYYNIGYGSYNLNNVFNWKDGYFEIVENRGEYKIMEKDYKKVYNIGLKRRLELLFKAKENEALEELKTFPINCLDFKENQALQIAIQDLEEIQQYRAIGTVEDIYNMFKVLNRTVSEFHLEVSKYRAIGTIEDFKALKEKNETKEPIKIKTDEKILYMCPSCRKVFIEAYDTVHRGHIPKYCEMCGQNIKWSWGQ